MSHTPGPWVVDADEGRILATDARQTIVVDSFGGSISNPAVLADARLIAAAPEMLNALRFITTGAGTFVSSSDIAELIAKAEAA
jgi:hypothetical protein